MKSIQDTYKLYNGVEIPCVGLGTWQSSNETAKLSVLAALSHGYKLIDTAAAYGNELGVGAGLKASGLKREEYFVTSKLRNANHGYEATMEAFELTIKKLGVDYLDLYLIHWPNPVQFRGIWKTAMQETWRAFEDLYKAKKIRAIGVSNFMPHHIEAYSPFGTGLIFDNEVMQNLAKKYNKTIAQICLRWCLQNDFVSVPKSANPIRIKDNTDIFDFELSAEDMDLIASLSGSCGEAPDPDTITF